MKLSILKQQLNEAIQNVSKAISSRTTIPILSGIKVDVTMQGVTLTASDTDISIQSFIPVEDDRQTIAQIERPGSVVLPAKFFVEIIKKLPSANIEIEVRDQFQTFLRAGSTDIQMVGLDPEEYPILPSVEENQVLTVNGDLLKTMIKQTVFSISSNETTPILTGVLWQLQHGEMKFVATDRHRLASRSATIEVDSDLHFYNIVIAGKTLNELSRIIPEHTKVDIVVADNQVLFKVGNVLFYTRILDGTYPDTSKIIPNQYKTELVLDTKGLTEAIDRAYLLSREEKTNIVRLQTKEDGTIEISSSSSELGRVTEQLEVKRFDGEPLRIAFNSKYMLDVLKVVECEQIFIGFTGAMSPIIIKPTEHVNSLHLILPYRTTN
ncbi:DNA polymerase III subunit beta [Paenibacillus sp. SC116]|uniref:DNA polymerase III subunit beta n=1 Tax=Paenibacillus sp. SC116 TaxID=2968986 RepID=UPI00215A5BBE|nr:DNA polymerase III subunit beta [Paenibacillus sp. SC116]MCR8844385.1 DNA polymerase III subunit beta [Paenibacillus sp. SC116]